MSVALKVVWAAAFLVLIGTTVHQTSENHRLRDNIQTLQKRQEALTERNAELEAEHVATNQLGALPIAQIQTTELLRLRAEVTRLNKIIHEQSRSVGERMASEAEPSESNLDEEQRRFLADMTQNIETKNSVADINRLKDTLTRWDELSTNMLPAKMMPVAPLLKQKVIERLAELEAEAANK